MSEGLIPVRVGEELDVMQVESYLRKELPDFAETHLQVDQFAAGHSNLTYRLRTAEGFSAVLRRPPLGPVAPKAHDMAREYAVLEAVQPQFPLAPKPLLLCNDQSVIGVPFYLMECLQGVVADKTWPGVYEPSPASARAMSEAVAQTLAKIHAVDCDTEALRALGHPEGYLRRQVEGWQGRHARVKTDEHARAEEIGRELLARVPASPKATLIHNDFKLNNLLLDPQDPGLVVGVVDWEMATIGDPLSDLAISLSYWAEVGDPPALAGSLSPLTTQAGFYSRSELASAYERASGRSIEHLSYYMAFANYKSAGICQQIYYRYRVGQTRDARFEHLGKLATGLLDLAAAYLAE